MSRNLNFAARAGRWSVRHRRRALIGWLVFVIAAVAIGGAAGTRTLGLAESNVGEAARADAILKEAGFAQPARERVLLSSPQAAADLRERLSAVRDVENVRGPVRIGESSLVTFDVRGAIDDAPARVAAAIAAVDAVRRAHPSTQIAHAGDASLQRAIDERIGKDFVRAELSAVPVTLIVLALAFGALVAALVPVLLGLSAVAAAIGLLALPSQLAPIHESTYTVVLLIGLAVAVDYALFFLRRAREERAAGRDSDAAVLAASATAGRAVLVSGATVIVAMAGMLVSDNPWYRSYAFGIVVVVVVAMLASVTVLPALLSLLGDRVERGRLPRLRGFGGTRVVDAVLRRPGVSALAATAVLLALASPVLGMKLAEQGLGALPADMPERVAAERIPGGTSPAVVVVSGGGAERLVARLAGDRRFGRAVVESKGGVARVSVPLAGNSVDARSDAALAALRDEIIPAAGVRAAVGGLTAQSADFRAETRSTGPPIIALVLGLSFAVLLVAFRSAVVAVKAIVLNLLSVLAAWGVLVLVFQHGVGDTLLGFEATGSVSTWIPLLTFVLLFGLSMDYHALILSRIREDVDAGIETALAVRHGVVASAGVVTSAAAVMIGVFSIFATLSLVDIKQVGVGLAVAVLIDATLVRLVLLPAAMALLGERNWWLPRITFVQDRARAEA